MDDHAILLCCLLLGFDLDAYVVVGADEDRNAHTWVMSRNGEEPPSFWEPMTGTRLRADDPNALSWRGRRLARVGCVFNHKRLYANVQRDDSVAEARWDLDNRAHWMCTQVGRARARARSRTRACGRAQNRVCWAQAELTPAVRFQQRLPLLPMTKDAAVRSPVVLPSACGRV